MLYSIKVFLVEIIIKLCYSTNAIIVRGRDNYKKIIKNNQSVIFSVWHGQLLSIIYDLRNDPINAVAGTHADAELITQIATKWGWNVIRGSSKEKGDLAYKKMIKILKEPRARLFITPDGPTGPAKIPKLGIVRAAQITNSAIIPISVYSTKRWGFTNWDTFYLEKPFGKIYIEYGQPIFLDNKLDQKESTNTFLKGMHDVEVSNLHYANNEDV